MKNYRFSTAFVTTYLVVYTILFHLDVSMPVLLLMFAISPFLVLWMVITILKYGVYNGRELGENEEWGYQDKIFGER